MIKIRFDLVPKNLMAGPTNGSNYQKGMGIPKSGAYKIFARPTQCITASFYLGFFKKERLVSCAFDLSTLSREHIREFERAVKRAKYPY